jgi:hypothetical protein
METQVGVDNLIVLIAWRRQQQGEIGPPAD